jgi:signal transduction histidine kinase
MSRRDRDLNDIGMPSASRDGAAGSPRMQVSKCVRALWRRLVTTGRVGSAADPAHWRRRRELERRLHDGPALRLAALSLELGLVAMELRETVAGGRVAGLQDQVRVIIEELREIGAEIYPPILGVAGIGPALRAYGERNRRSLTVVAGPERFPEPVEAAAYFAAADALDAEPGSPAEITVRRTGDTLVVAMRGVARGCEVRIPCG